MDATLNAAFIAAELLVGLAAGMWASSKKHSLPFYAILLAVLLVLLGIPGLIGGFAALAYRYYK